MIHFLVTSFNSSKFLRQTLDSIINQTYEGMIRIVMSDDASIDDSQEIIKEYSEKFYYDRTFTGFCHEKNLGGHGRQNWKFLFDSFDSLGIRDDDFVAMLDGDDYLAPDRISKQMIYMKENELNACHADCAHIYEDGTMKHPKFWENMGQFIMNPMDVESQIKNNRIFTCTLIGKAHLMKRAFNFDLITSLGIFLGDYAGSSRLAKITKIGYIDESLAFYRWRASSESHRDSEKLIADTGLVSYLLRTGKLLEDLQNS